jgi:hypothetical protein
MAAYVRDNDADGFVSSVLLSLELRRAVQRIDPRALPRADLELTRVTLVGLSGPVIETAGRFPDPGLRSLGAIHIATALLLRDELSALVSYDERLVSAAVAGGLPAVSPGEA